MITTQRMAFILAPGVAALLSFLTMLASRADTDRTVTEPDALARASFVSFQPGDKALPAGERPYLGFKSCLRCHLNGIAGEVELPGGGKVNLMDEQWVFYREYPIWAKEDKHGQAYTVLLNERSKKMGEKLGVAEIHRDQRCLACHTGFPLSQMPVEKDGLVHKDLAKSLDINLGVSCEGCHGSSGDGKESKGWMTPHQAAPSMPYEKTKPWRFLSPQVKRDEFGFYDVRSPSSKTKLCVSCHVGDVALGRIVTHEMYAVGHPPLPGFEIEMFTEQMPRHWAEFAAKADKVQEHFVKHTADPLYDEKTYKKDNLHRTRTLLAGTLVAAGEYVRYVGELADDDLKIPVAKPAWPEFAAFDCYACHHELKHPSWRQQRKPPAGPPGRPPLPEWPFVLAKVALKTLGTPRADFDAKLADLRQTIAAKPFGNKKELPKAAQAASAWLLTKGMELEKKQLKQEEGLALLSELAEIGSTETLDYDSARILVWAFQVVQSDVKAKQPSREKIAKAIEPIGKDLLLLNLRGGRKAATAVPGDKGPEERKTVEVDLEIVLPLISNYQPSVFQERFRDIAGLLKQ
jgi:hypothetical protein